MLYQALTGHLYCIPDNLFGLIPKPPEQSYTPLFSSDGQSPPDFIHNVFVTTSRELSTYRSEMSQPLLSYTNGNSSCGASRDSPEPSSHS